MKILKRSAKKSCQNFGKKKGPQKCIIFIINFLIVTYFIVLNKLFVIGLVFGTNQKNVLMKLEMSEISRQI